MEQRKKGGQPNNSNAVRHGVHASVSKLAPDSPQARAIAAYECELLQSLGDCSVQERLLIRRASVAAFRLAILDGLMIAQPMDFEGLEDRRLQWSRELRETLTKLGLKQATQPTETLASYLAKYDQEQQKNAFADGEDKTTRA